MVCFQPSAPFRRQRKVTLLPSLVVLSLRAAAHSLRPSGLHET